MKFEINTILINLIHVFLIGPFLLYIGYNKSRTPRNIFEYTLALGIFVILFHLYKIYIHFKTDNKQPSNQENFDGTNDDSVDDDSAVEDDSNFDNSADGDEKTGDNEKTDSDDNTDDDDNNKVDEKDSDAHKDDDESAFI